MNQFRIFCWPLIVGFSFLAGCCDKKMSENHAQSTSQSEKLSRVLIKSLQDTSNLSWKNCISTQDEISKRMHPIRGSRNYSFLGYNGLNASEIQKSIESEVQSNFKFCGEFLDSHGFDRSKTVYSRIIFKEYWNKRDVPSCFEEPVVEFKQNNSYAYFILFVDNFFETFRINGIAPWMVCKIGDKTTSITTFFCPSQYSIFGLELRGQVLFSNRDLYSVPCFLFNIEATRVSNVDDEQIFYGCIAGFILKKESSHLARHLKELAHSGRDIDMKEDLISREWMARLKLSNVETNVFSASLQLSRNTRWRPVLER